MLRTDEKLPKVRAGEMNAIHTDKINKKARTIKTLWIFASRTSKRQGTSRNKKDGLLRFAQNKSAVSGSLPIQRREKGNGLIALARGVRASPRSESRCKYPGTLHIVPVRSGSTGDPSEDLREKACENA